MMFAVSCSGPDNSAAALGEVPDTVSEGFRQVSVSPDGRVEITSDRVEVFTKKDFTVFYSSRVQEIGPDGELRMDGTADYLKVSGNKDGTAKGNIHIKNIKENAGIDAENLQWNHKDRLLSSEDAVSISTEDGLDITGSGFEADMARNTFSFSQNVRGTVEIKDAEE